MNQIILVGFLFLTCCGTINQEGTTMVASGRIDSVDSIWMRFSHERKFRLDSVTNAKTFSVAVYPKENPHFLLFHHPSANKIAVYEIQSGERVSTIKFEKEGPNGVGTGVRAMHFISFDSIFLFSTLAQKLLLVDSSGSIKNRYDVSNEKAYALLGTTYPAFLKNNTLHLCAYPPPGRKASSIDFSMLKLNLKTGEVGHAINMSKEYDRGFWGKHNYLRVHHINNDKQNVIIANFPNDHFVYFIRADNSIQKHYAGARRIGKLEPVSEAYMDDDLKTFAHEAKQGFYSAIFYDRWNDFYYRIAYNPIETDLTALSGYGLSSIILLDKNLKKIGEMDIERDTYVFGSSFITPEGLYLFNEKKYNANDDYLFYDVYKIQPKE